MDIVVTNKQTRDLEEGSPISSLFPNPTPNLGIQEGPTKSSRNRHLWAGLGWAELGPSQVEKVQKGSPEGVGVYSGTRNWVTERERRKDDKEL